MKKNSKDNKYLAIKGQTGFIARLCGCSRSYVLMVLNGERDPKTERAHKAGKVIAKAEQLLQLTLNQ